MLPADVTARHPNWTMSAAELDAQRETADANVQAQWARESAESQRQMNRRRQRDWEPEPKVPPTQEQLEQQRVQRLASERARKLPDLVHERVKQARYYEVIDDVPSAERVWQEIDTEVGTPVYHNPEWDVLRQDLMDNPQQQTYSDRAFDAERRLYARELLPTNFRPVLGNVNEGYGFDTTMEDDSIDEDDERYQTALFDRGDLPNRGASSNTDKPELSRDQSKRKMSTAERQRFMEMYGWAPGKKGANPQRRRVNLDLI
jgi:hypothetical protein